MKDFLVGPVVIGQGVMVLNLEEVKVSSPEVQSCDPTYCPASSTQDPELHCLMVKAAKAAPNLHIRNQSLFVR